MLRTNYCYGFSLLEVLVATFVLGFGLLGIMGIYLHSLQRMENSYWYTLADSQLITMAEMSRITGSDFGHFQGDCKRLLPHGECVFVAGMIEICWQAGGQKQCLSPLKIYES